MTSPSPDAILHLATLKLLSDAGFPSTSKAASLTLSAIAAKYLRTVAAICAERAQLAGRSKVGTADVADALGEVGEDVEELEEWLVNGRAGEGGFVGSEGLGGEYGRRSGMVKLIVDRMQQGLDLPEALAELNLVRTASVIPEEDEMEDEVQVKAEPYAYIRARSPDLSWLPPLPGTTVTSDHKTIQEDPDPSDAAPIANQPKLSLAEKYRTRQSYASSQLAQSSFSAPIPHPSPPVPVISSSSFNLLLETYKATAGEPSVSLAQTPLRQQAADLLRRVVAPPDIYGTSDSLSGDLPGPILSLGPSASESLPIPTIPVNPHPTGMLSQLVREMRSPFLSPVLRDRLTTLRPPVALKDANGQPVYYGAPVRGPDEVALNKARGKPAEEAQEAFYRYTYDAGPRGVEKWGNGALPTGKTVIKSVEGEEKPRTSERAPAPIRFKLDRSPSIVLPNSPGDISMGEAGPVDLPGQKAGGPKLRISTASLSPNPTMTSISPAPNSSDLAPSPQIRIPRLTLSPNPPPGPSTAHALPRKPSFWQQTQSPVSAGESKSGTGDVHANGESVRAATAQTGPSAPGIKIRLGVRKESTS